MEEQEKLTSLVIDDSRYETRLTGKFVNRVSYRKADPKQITAYIPGLIQALHVQPGQKVKMGESMLVLEAMKMQNNVTAPQDGTIKFVHVEKNERVMKNHLLIEFE
ncbi:MAG: biotin/lipoyl-containing protein [Bacteroidota bacterium]